MIQAILFLASFATAVLAAPKVIWDGRLKKDFPAADLDKSATSPYNAEFVLGAGQKWSEQLHFPDMGVTGPSLFDLVPSDCRKPVEVTINDKSIFAPGGKAQNGFRRSELLPNTNNGTDATVQGTTTLHLSVREDIHRPLNYSHQYEIAFIETNDFSSHVWTLKTGTPFGSSGVTAKDAKTLRLGSSTAGGKAEEVLFSVPFGSECWHNFAVQTNWVDNTISVWYSSGYALLSEVVKTRANNATGKGQAHIGILKLPTPPATDLSHEGYQPSGIKEGLIYGGLFVEDSSKGGASLSPW
ncbi:Glycoside Hydrolase Family 131 protein [Tuber magnatum]|uniref:Glycoside Hydrolase Family 131 protein n=1 Tax=Tuber magnatum TaxID=42249 RepID=A0A317SZB0_9PEZI|nr:Glycoside Hydrolase Family 131 protein [Tuber magnatum]